MREKGVAVETIAAVEECEPAYVRMLLNGAEKKDDAPGSTPVEKAPPRPRRLSRRAAQYRAWEIVQQRPVPGLGLDANAFWIRLIVEIHETGDGFRLGIGEPASRFSTRGDLAVLFARPDHLEIDDWLNRLFERGRLIDIDGIDIGIPAGMKLTPAENISGKKRPAPPPQDGQTVMLHAVPGGLPDATENPPQTQIKPELNLRSGATEIPDGANLNPIKFAPIADARTAAAAAYAKESNPLAAAVAAEPCAGGATETRIKFAPDASEIPPGDGLDATEINSQRPDHDAGWQRNPPAEMTAELVALAKLGRAVNAEDLGQVEAWIAQGLAADTMRGVIEIKLAHRNGRAPASLRYFDGAMQDTRKAQRTAVLSASALPSSRAQPPAAPLSEADKATRDLLKPSQDAWRKDRSSPFAPTLEVFKAACLTEKGKLLAHRWPELWAVWDRTGRPGDLKPPDFMLLEQDPDRFEMALLEIEEELTAPHPQQAAD